MNHIEEKLSNQLKISRVLEMKTPTILMNDRDFVSLDNTKLMRKYINVNNLLAYNGIDIPIVVREYIEQNNIIVFDASEINLDTTKYMKKEETTNKVDLVFYTRPFHRQKYGGWVYDAKGNFVFQFDRKFNKEEKFDENGEYITRKGSHLEGAIELEDTFIFSLNALGHEPVEGLNLTISKKDAGCLLNNGEQFLTIRGWGNLTGTGAHNFPAEKAEMIQDTFRDWLIYKTK